MKSQSIPHLLNESEHRYWILDIENEGHSMWVIWTSGLQECKGNFSFQSQAVAVFDCDLKNSYLFSGGCSNVPDRGLRLLSTST